MRKPLPAVCVALLALLVSRRASLGAADRVLVLTHAAVIDGVGSPVQGDMTVAVANGRITDISRTGASPLPEGAEVVDLSGKYIIPGLWDMHVHLSLAGETALGALVASGVVGVRDLGGDIWQIDQWRSEISRGSRLGPEIVRAGPLVDGPKPGAPHRLTVTNAEEARCAVTTLKTGLGVDLIKVHSYLPREAFFALLEEARAQKIPVACHLPESATAAEASARGCKSIEHAAESLVASFGYERVNPSKSPEESAARLVSQPGIRLFEVFRHNGTWVDPTLAAYESFVKMGRSPEERDAREAILNSQIAAVGTMHRMGVRLLAGSDFADAEAGLTPGVSLQRELEFLVRSGLSPLEAIQIATRDAAEFLGKLQETGTVTKGKRADLVLLDADPLANVSNIRRIWAVVVRGRLIAKADLARLTPAE